jgi:hypothetical protein
MNSGYFHNRVNQDQLTSIQLAQKLGRTRMLCVLDNPIMRQRLLMNPKPQLPNRKVEPPVESHKKCHTDCEERKTEKCSGNGEK